MVGTEVLENFVGTVDKGGIKLRKISGFRFNNIRVELAPLIDPFLQNSVYGPGREVKELLA